MQLSIKRAPDIQNTFHTNKTHENCLEHRNTHITATILPFFED